MKDSTILILFVLVLVPGLAMAQSADSRRSTAGPADAVYAHLPLDGSIVDIVSGATPTVTVGTDAVEGKIGGAIHFDGDSFVELPIDLSPDVIPEMTITLLVRPDPLPLGLKELAAIYPNAYMVSDGDGLLLINNQQNETPYFTAFSTGTVVSNSLHPGDRDKWQFIAMTRKTENRPTRNGLQQEQTVLTLYSNGTESKSIDDFDNRAISSVMRLGANSKGSSSKFNGSIDDIRVYSRVLSAAEIENLATAALGGDASGRNGEVEGAQPVPLAALPPRNVVEMPDPIAPVPRDDDVSERLRDAERNARGADWRIDDVFLLSPDIVLPDSKIYLRVHIAKNDPLNLQENVLVAVAVAVAVADAGNGRVVELVTSTMQPDASIVVEVQYELRRVAAPELGEIATLPLQVSIYAPDGSTLVDVDSSNNTKVISLEIVSPSVAVCGRIEFRDYRTVTDRESKLTSTNRTRGLGGLHVELWQTMGACQDVDPGCGEGGGDRFVAKTVARLSGLTSEIGSYCFIAERKSRFYLRTNYQSDIARIVKRDGAAPVVGSPLIDLTGDELEFTTNWNVACPSLAFESACSTRQNSNEFQMTYAWANTMATLADVQRAYTGPEILPRVNVSVDPDALSDCDGVFSGKNKNNQARPDGKLICVATPWNNHRVTHEFGHLVMRRALNFFGDFIASCGGLTGWSDERGERCAVSEGFANFFAGAVYYEPDADSPFYSKANREFEGPTASANDKSAEECVANSGDPYRTEGNVARFFWDLFDSTNEGLNRGGWGDDTTMTLNEIVAGWRAFAPGDDDREAEEGGTSAAGDKNNNGRNAWDYVCRVPEAESELIHNCLKEQDGPISKNSCEL